MKQKLVYGVIALLVGVSVFVLGWKGQEVWKGNLNGSVTNQIQDRTEKNTVVEKQDVPTLPGGTFFPLSVVVPGTRSTQSYTVEYLPGWRVISEREGISKEGATITFRKEISGKPKDYLCVLFDVIPGIFTEVYSLKEGEGRIVRTLPNGFEYFEQSSPRGAGSSTYGYTTGRDRKNRVLFSNGHSFIGRISANCFSADFQTATLAYDQMVKRPEYAEAIDMLGSFRGGVENKSIRYIKAYSSKNLGIDFQYFGEWEVRENQSGVSFYTQEMMRECGDLSMCPATFSVSKMSRSEADGIYSQYNQDVKRMPISVGGFPSERIDSFKGGVLSSEIFFNTSDGKTSFVFGLTDPQYADVFSVVLQSFKMK